MIFDVFYRIVKEGEGAGWGRPSLSVIQRYREERERECEREYIVI